MVDEKIKDINRVYIDRLYRRDPKYLLELKKKWLHRDKTALGWKYVGGRWVGTRE